MKKFLFFALIGIFAMSCEKNPPLEIIASGYCGAQGDNLTWILTEDSVLTISGSGDMAEYGPWMAIGGSFGSNAPWWLHYRDFIKTVVIEDGVTNIGGYAFAILDELTSVTIGNSVTTIGMQAFQESRNLTSVIIGNSVTTIERSAFFGCVNLTSVTIPNSVKIIEDMAFMHCYYLTSVAIGNGVTTIGRLAFTGCHHLTSLIIGYNVTTIGELAFSSSRNLTSITSFALIPPNLERSVFDWVDTETCILRVPTGSIELYRNAQGWQDFQNIVAIQD